MIKTQYFIAVYDENTGWEIGDEPFFPASAAFVVCEDYQKRGWTVAVVEQIQRVVKDFPCLLPKAA